MNLSQTSTGTSPESAVSPRSFLILLTHEFQPFHGGVATYCVELARSLNAQGQIIEVWAPDYNRSLPESSDTFPLRRLPGPGNLRPAGLFHLARSVWQRRKSLEGSLLLLPSVGAQMVLMLLSLLPGWPRVPTAVLWHGSEILRFQRNPFWKILARRLYAKADYFFAASPFARTLALESSLLPEHREVHVIPCAPASDAFLPAEPLASDDQGRVRILTLARLHPRKGQRHSIRALSALPADLKKRFVYQVAGEGASGYLNELRQSCLENGIAFEYLGPVPGSRLSSIYAQCDIYAMTSRSLPLSVEGFGITYLEAGLQSKPVIACRTGGVEGAVLDGKTGLLVQENDLPALTQAFASLISDPSLRQKLGEENRRHAVTFSWEASAGQLQSILGKSVSDPS